MSALISRYLAPYTMPLAVVAALAYTAAVYTAGFRSANSTCRAAEYKGERDAALRDLNVARTAASEAARLSTEARRDAEELQKKVDLYAKSLPANAACRLSDADIRRLRNIR